MPWCHKDFAEVAFVCDLDNQEDCYVVACVVKHGDVVQYVLYDDVTCVVDVSEVNHDFDVGGDGNQGDENDATDVMYLVHTKPQACVVVVVKVEKMMFLTEKLVMRG